MMENIECVIDRKGYSLSVERECLRIEFEGALKERIPLRFLSSLSVYANTWISSRALVKLAEFGVPVAFLGMRGDSVPVWLGNNRIHIRDAQFRAAFSSNNLGLAKHLVLRKFMAMRAVAREMGLNRSDAGAFLEEASLEQQVAALSVATHHDSVRGIEGRVTRAWFCFLRQQISPTWGFDARNRRPPKDPVNALLSLSYTLALTRVTALVNERGLDPARGYLHEIYSGRPSLSLDLLEPLRPLVDQFVVSVMDHFSEKDFTTSEDGCFLRKQARGRYFALWQQWLSAPVTHTHVAKALSFQKSALIDPTQDFTSITRQMIRSFGQLLKIARHHEHEAWLSWLGKETSEEEEDNGKTDESNMQPRESEPCLENQP